MGVVLLCIYHHGEREARDDRMSRVDKPRGRLVPFFFWVWEVG